MVYYTFNDESVSLEKRQLLFRAAKKVLDTWGFEPRVYDSNEPKPLWLIGNKDPYIEINGPYGWLTIRKLTNMKQEDADSLVDAIEEAWADIKDGKYSGGDYYGGSGGR